jgi:hypothetical protein
VRSDFPNWEIKYDLPKLFSEMVNQYYSAAQMPANLDK